MGVLINHSITFMTSPVSVGLALLLLALIFGKRRILARTCVILSFVVLYAFSSGVVGGFLGGYLERMYPPQPVESLPQADAIVLLGGGAGGNTNTLVYAEMYMSGDRVVQAARLYKAGKAPKIVTSGEGERYASVPLLREYGVPDSAIVIEEKAGNTEQNARFVREMILADKPKTRPRILLVTSSWHMRRAMLMFKKYVPDVDVIPSACDYEYLSGWSEGFDPRCFLPSADGLLKNSYYFKEIIGYWGYRLLR